MDSGVSVRAAGATPSTPVVRADAPAKKEHVRTELARAKAVEASNKALDARHEQYNLEAQQKRAAHFKESLDRNIELDPESHEVITKFRDPESGRVVKQIPEEARLKLQAYVRNLVEKDQQAEKHIEIKA